MNEIGFLCEMRNLLHLSKLIIDPAVAARGVVYSSCFFRRTNHQSIAKIARATNLIVAHSPTYLYKMPYTLDSNYVKLLRYIPFNALK